MNKTFSKTLKNMERNRTGKFSVSAAKVEIWL